MFYYTVMPQNYADVCQRLEIARLDYLKSADEIPEYSPRHKRLKNMASLTDILDADLKARKPKIERDRSKPAVAVSHTERGLAKRLGNISIVTVRNYLSGISAKTGVTYKTPER